MALQIQTNGICETPMGEQASARPRRSEATRRLTSRPWKASIFHLRGNPPLLEEKEYKTGVHLLIVRQEENAYASCRFFYTH